MSSLAGSVGGGRMPEVPHGESMLGESNSRMLLVVKHENQRVKN
jgi:hypothetical protein